MFNNIKRVAAVIALTGWMGVANATLIFDFSWDSSEGKISGVILGLQDNVSLQAASAVIVTDINGEAVNIEFTCPIWCYVSANRFDVSGGELLRFNFISDGNYYDLLLHNTAQSIANRYILEWNYYNEQVVYRGGPGNEISLVNRVTVPEPDSVILVLLGLAGLSFARYRKQS
jgi:hypothetical protein